MKGTLLLLGAGIASALLSASQVSAGTGTTTSLSIGAASGLHPTGLMLKRGESATITATGTISYGSQNEACSGSGIGPDGCSAETICIVPGPCGALIGRVGAGPAFVAGTKTTVDGPGALSLGVNDAAGAYGDNSGAFSVRVAVKGLTEAAKVLTISSGHLYVRRAGSDRAAALRPGDTIYLGDELLTTQDGKAALEFTIGGRARVGSGADVTVTGERSISGGKEDAGLEFLWKSGSKSGDVHVEIQTNGGVLGGIKG